MFVIIIKTIIQMCGVKAKIVDLVSGSVLHI